MNYLDCQLLDIIPKDCINALGDINSQGQDGWGTLLHVAVLRADPAIVKFLVDSGVSVLAWSKMHNDLAIHKAAIKGRADIIRILLDAGSPWDFPGGPKNRTPLHNAALAATPKAIEAMTVLLDAGANPDMEDDSGMTALDYTRKNPYVFDSEGYQSLVERLR